VLRSLCQWHRLRCYWLGAKQRRENLLDSNVNLRISDYRNWSYYSLHTESILPRWALVLIYTSFRMAGMTWTLEVSLWKQINVEIALEVEQTDTGTAIHKTLLASAIITYTVVINTLNSTKIAADYFSRYDTRQYSFTQIIVTNVWNTCSLPSYVVIQVQLIVLRTVKTVLE